MRRLTVIVIALAALVLAAPDALAADGSPVPGIPSVDELRDSLPDEAREVLGGGEGVFGFDAAGVTERLMDMALSALGDIFRSALGGAAAVLGTAMLCGAVSSMWPDRRGAVDYVDLVGVLAITASVVGGADTMIGEASRCVDSLSELSTLLLPVMASASAASGAAASGAAKYAASMLFISVLTTLGRTVILPMIYAFIAASASTAAFGGAAGPAKAIARVIRTLLTVICTAFTLYLTVTGLIASSADAAAVKLTRTAISTLLPVVGGMVADASDAVASGVGVIRSAAGALGAAAVLAVCVLPVLRLAVGSFIYRAAAELGETVAPPKLTQLIESVGTAYSLALGLAGAEAAMLLVSVVAAAMTLAG